MRTTVAQAPQDLADLLCRKNAKSSQRLSQGESRRFRKEDGSGSQRGRRSQRRAQWPETNASLRPCGPCLLSYACRRFESPLIGDAEICGSKFFPLYDTRYTRLAANFVYRGSCIVYRATENTPRGHLSLLDQFRGASTSIALNIAEGAGRYAKGEKKQFYSIAKGSAYECVPID